MSQTIQVPTPRSRRGSLFKERLALPSPPIAFIGDSIFAKFGDEGLETWETYYEPLNCGNMGTIGDSTQMLIEKLERDELPLQETTAVVLMIGSTDLRHRVKVPVVFDQIRKIIQLLQAGCRGGVKILLLGILPRGDANSDLNSSSISELNEHLSNLENGFTLRFVNLEPSFYDKEKAKIREELFHTDRINLSSKGYTLFAQKIDPVLKEILEGK